VDSLTDVDQVESLMDVEQLAEIDFEEESFTRQCTLAAKMIQQVAMQLAAIRKLLELEHDFRHQDTNKPGLSGVVGL
jgi:hypothetical protein